MFRERRGLSCDRNGREKQDYFSRVSLRQQGVTCDELPQPAGRCHGSGNPRTADARLCIGLVFASMICRSVYLFPGHGGSGCTPACLFLCVYGSKTRRPRQDWDIRSCGRDVLVFWALCHLLRVQKSLAGFLLQGFLHFSIIIIAWVCTLIQSHLLSCCRTSVTSFKAVSFIL